MFDTYLRNLKDRIGEPLARRMPNVPPGSVTLTALFFGLGSAALAANGLFLWGLAFWLLNRALDGLDGLLARLHNHQDDFGGYLDILFDFVAYAAVPIGLVLAAPTLERFLALTVMLASFYVNTASWMYLAAILEKRSARDPDTATTIIMPSGLVGGFETSLAYGIFLLFPAYITVLFYFFSTLVFITIMQRLVWARRTLVNGDATCQNLSSADQPQISAYKPLRADKSALQKR
jgi:phosphatidylglycerophosphate synthase